MRKMQANQAAMIIVALGLVGTRVFAQYEDLSNLPNGSAEDSQARICAFQGLKIQKKDGFKGSSDVTVSFLFSGKPSVYFNYYDAQKNAVVFDFYDAHIGGNSVDIHEPPITGGTLDSVQIDLNKDAKGMAPDIRDVVRVSLFTAYNLEYEAQEAGGAVTMSYNWSSRKEAQFKRQKKAIYWEFPLALAAAGGVGFTAYELFLKKSPAEGEESPLNKLPSHPPGQ
jgi:hypothetical protein